VIANRIDDTVGTPAPSPTAAQNSLKHVERGQDIDDRIDG